MQKDRLTRIERILILWWGDPRSRVPNLVILVGLAMLANPWWLPVVYAAAITYLQLAPEPFYSAEKTMSWTGWIVFVVGVLLYLRPKSSLFATELVDSEVSIALFGSDEDRNIVLAVPLVSGHILEFPLNLEIGNEGEVSLNDVEAYLRMPKMLCFGGAKNFEIQFDGSSKIRVEPVASSDKRQSFVYLIDTLHPKQGAVLRIPLSLTSETVAGGSVEFSDGDRQRSFKYQFEYTFMVDLTLHSADRPPVSRSCRVHVINTNEGSIEEKLNERNLRYKEDLTKKLEAMTSWQRLRFRPIVKPVFVYEVKDDQIQRDATNKIDRFVEGATMEKSEGLLSEHGYFIPAAGVGISVHSNPRES